MIKVTIAGENGNIFHRGYAEGMDKVAGLVSNAISGRVSFYYTNVDGLTARLHVGSGCTVIISDVPPEGPKE